MNVIHGLAIGIGLLILAYLLAKNADGYAKLLGVGFTGVNTETRTLQGR